MNAAAASVGDYHVVLWTGVLLASILIVTVYFMLEMGGEPLDSQLKAQVVDRKAVAGGPKK